MNYLEEYNDWLEGDFADCYIKEELKEIIGNTTEIEDRFYKNLEFGTAGLRGIIGAGTNRMNILTVAKATQGLANYLNKKNSNGARVAIAYDSRHKSAEFAKKAADVLCANNIEVYMFKTLKSTPELSFTIKRLNCDSGIVITASHNPLEYNGYKAYNSYGGQILDKEAEDITNEIEAVDFRSINYPSEEDLCKIHYIDELIDSEYTEYIKSLSFNSDVDKDLKIVYTPLNGTGNIPVRRVLNEMGYKNIYTVSEQENPDPNFTTLKLPNPEDKQAFEYGLKLAVEKDADLILATDPDCDRVGVMVKNASDDYEILTGNQIGALLIDYILKSKLTNSENLESLYMVNTIVTSDLGECVAKEYGIDTIKTLTGFKYIADVIRNSEKSGVGKFIFGYEESYGFLTGDRVRDKDGVAASMLIAEMCAYYKKRNQTLVDVLNSLYQKYGYFREKTISIVSEGINGQKKIKRILELLRESKPSVIGLSNVKYMYDFKLGIKYDLILGNFESLDFPKSDVLKFCLEDGSWFVIRPSGTEPKLKIYFSARNQDLNAAENTLNDIEKDVCAIINCII